MLTQVLALALMKGRPHGSFVHGLHVLHRRVARCPAAPPLAAALGPHPSSSGISRGGGSEDRGVRAPAWRPRACCGRKEGRQASSWVVWHQAQELTKKDENLVIIHKQFSKILES